MLQGLPLHSLWHTLLLREYCRLCYRVLLSTVAHTPLGLRSDDTRQVHHFSASGHHDADAHAWSGRHAHGDADAHGGTAAVATVWPTALHRTVGQQPRQQPAIATAAVGRLVAASVDGNSNSGSENNTAQHCWLLFTHRKAHAQAASRQSAPSPPPSPARRERADVEERGGDLKSCLF
jgi:hypothetical protein